MVARLYSSQVGQSHQQADGAMSAHVEHAHVIKKDDPSSVGWVAGRTEQGTNQYVAATRLIDDGRAEVIEMGSETQPLVRQCVPRKFRHSCDNDAGWFTTGVGVYDINSVHAGILHILLRRCFCFLLVMSTWLWYG